jgi:hypothetical protein
MAKKAKAKKSARKSKARKPKTAAPLPPPVGTVTVTTVVDVSMRFVSPANGVRIDLDHLGIGKDANAVAETSGNFKYLDAANPPVIEGNDLLVRFAPELSAGQWNFQFTFKWTDDMETLNG